MVLLAIRLYRRATFGRTATLQNKQMTLLGAKVVRSDAQVALDDALESQIKSGPLKQRLRAWLQKQKPLLRDRGRELRYWFNLFTGLDEMRYWVNAWRCERATNTREGMCPWMQSLSTGCFAPYAFPPCTPNETLTGFPRSSTTVHFNYADIKRQLAEFHDREGEESAYAEVVRENALGLYACNTAMWPELPPRAASVWLSETIEDHCSFRQFALVLMAAEDTPGVTWTREAIRRDANKFIRSRLHATHGLSVQSDLRLWVSRVLHRMTIGLQLDDEEEARMVKWQASFLRGIRLPASLASVGKQLPKAMDNGESAAVHSHPISRLPPHPSRATASRPSFLSPPHPTFSLPSCYRSTVYARRKEVGHREVQGRAQSSSASHV